MDVALNNRYTTRIEHETAKTFLVIKLLQPEKERIYQHQIEMLANNPIKTILPFDIRRMNDETCFYYDITSKSPLVDYLNSKTLTKKDLVDFLTAVTVTLIECRNLFLSDKNFLMGVQDFYVDVTNNMPCMVYLPIDSMADSAMQLKDFVVMFITKLAYIEIKDGDHYLQRIIEGVKSNHFSAVSFLGVLKEISSDPIHPINDIKRESRKEFGEPAGLERFLEYEGTSEGLDRGKEEKTVSVKKSLLPLKELEVKTIILALASQILIICLSIILERVLKRYIPESLIRYVAIGLLVLGFDLLVFKRLVIRTNPADCVLSSQNVQLQESIKPKDSKAREKVEQPVTQEENSSALDIANADIYSALEDKSTHWNTAIDRKNYKMNSTVDFNETVLLSVEPVDGAFLVGGQASEESRVRINAGGYLIGRSEEACDLLVNERAVGRIHAEIIYRDGEYYILDKNSKNGTFINEEKLEGGQEYRLKHDDFIRFANCEYRFVLAKETMVGSRREDLCHSSDV